MRAFAGGFYSNLKLLYDHLDVPYQSQHFLFQFAEVQKHSPAEKESPAQHESYFVHASNLHQVAPRPSGIGRVQYLTEVAYLLACYIWFSI